MSRLSLALVAIALVSLSNSGSSSPRSEGSAREAHADLVAMPKGPTWQRPAPATWSSRANVRWEARFGQDSRYIA